MKLGAFDYLQKPINPTILQQKIELALSQSIHTSVKEVKKESKKNSALTQNKVIKGKSHVMQSLYSHIDLRRH